MTLLDFPYAMPGMAVAMEQLGSLKHLERMLSYVSVSDPKSCWGWSRGKDVSGYGAFRSLYTTVKAHRMVATLCLSETQLDSEQHVMHKCDNPSCCNPRHLKVGTHLENMRDMFSKKRRTPAEGEDHPVCRLSQQQVLQIRKLHVKGSRTPGTRTSDLAKRFGVSRQHVNAIARGSIRKNH